MPQQYFFLAMCYSGRGNDLRTKSHMQLRLSLLCLKAHVLLFPAIPKTITYYSFFNLYSVPNTPILFLWKVT